MRNFILFLVAALFLASGCMTLPEDQTTVSTAGFGNPIGPGDRLLLDIAKKLPDFGGMFYDEEGNINVYTVENVQSFNSDTLRERTQEYERVLASILGKEFLSQIPRMDRNEKEKLATIPQLKIVKGDYRVTQLMEWRLNTDPILEIDGIVFTDLDEQKNRVRIGIESKVLLGNINKLLEKLKIPKEAVIVDVVKPFVFFDTLQSKFRPSPGGVQVEIDTSLLGFSNCTLGFNAHRSGVKGFVANSHCTKTQGAVDGADFHQPDDPLFSEGNKIGDEIADPPFFIDGICPSGRKCRYSDSAFIKYSVKRGTSIAKTDSWSNGSLTISNNPPKKLHIVGENSNWISGSELDKIGRTTGWTIGNIGGTCMNTNVSATNITLICQTEVKRITGQTLPISDFGDSGSPVFRWQGDNVVLAGILWGGLTDGSEFIFSPINQIEQELGSLITFDFPTPPIITGCSAKNCCEWEIPSIPPGNNKPICKRCLTTSSPIPTFPSCYLNEDGKFFLGN